MHAGALKVFGKESERCSVKRSVREPKLAQSRWLHWSAWGPLFDRRPLHFSAAASILDCSLIGEDLRQSISEVALADSCPMTVCFNSGELWETLAVLSAGKTGIIRPAVYPDSSRRIAPAGPEQPFLLLDTSRIS